LPATTTTPRRRVPRARRALVASVVLLALVAAACSSEDLKEGGIPATGGTLPTVTRAQVEGSTGQLDRIVADVMGETGIPGVAVGVVFDDQTVITKGYGVRENGEDATVDDQTVFQMASLSKPVGSTAVAGLVGDGTIAWDDTISSHLPGFELSDPYVTQHVTIADMYSHRSGLPGFAGNDLETMGFDQATILDRLQYLPLEPFRATYDYSNFGMTVGGVAAADAAGTTFAQLAQDQLFGPAGMTSTSARYADFLARDDKALIHAKVDGTYEAAFTREPDAQAPAGGISSNVVDLSRWMRLQLNDGSLDGNQIIDGDALTETHRPQMNSRATGDPSEPIREYGLGWDLSQSEADPALVQWAHSGAFTQGAGTTVRLLPQLGLGVVVLTNAAPVGGAETIADAYVDTLLNGSQTRDWQSLWASRFAPITTPPVFPVPTDPTPAKADSAYVGTYRNDYYGTVTIAQKGGGMEIAWGPGLTATLPLEHYDGDVFLYVDSPEIQGAKTPLAFQFTGGSTASSLVLAGETAQGDWMVLNRVS
jgi:CubicO group peptidase (beta-lactamase class C family)